MPGPDELPASIRDLAFRNGIPVRPDPDFHKDLDVLVRGLRALSAPSARRKTAPADAAEAASSPTSGSEGRSGEDPAAEERRGIGTSPAARLLVRTLRRSSKVRTFGWIIAALVVALAVPVAYIAWWYFVPMLWEWSTESWWLWIVKWWLLLVACAAPFYVVWGAKWLVDYVARAALEAEAS